MAGIFLIAAACATPTPVRPPEYGMNAPPGMMAPMAPPVQRATGPWARRRLGYTALTYQMPEAPEELRVNDDDHCEIARVSRDQGHVRYEVRSFEHNVVALNNIDQLIANAMTGVAQRVGGVRRSQVALTQGAYPGVDLTFDFPQTGATLRLRMLVGRTRSYTALMAYPTLVDRYLREDIQRFLEGLEFDDGDRPEADGDGALGGLRHVEPVGAWFAAQMPGSPRREALTFNTPQVTRPRVLYTVGSPNGAERYTVAVTVFERSVPPDAPAVALAALSAAGWSVRSERPSTTQGYAGRTYTLEQTGGASVTELKLLVTRSRLYEFAAMHPSAPDADCNTRVRGFFDSLRIL
jgi:hypothetical protein